MSLYTDQAGRTINIPLTPKRIISLVPSQTELLFDLGLDEEVVGITKFCIHPENWHRSKTRVGGTKQLNMETIHTLKPDLIIANKEENVKEQVEELAVQYPVWVSDVNNLEDACEMIAQVGLITNRNEQAIQIAAQIRNEFGKLKTKNHKPKTVYLIWKDPYMTVGGDTFIHAMLTAAGLDNIFANNTRYPELTLTQLQAANCELLLLSSEPYPFKQKHIDKLQALLPATKIILADGEMFSWYGSRLLKAPQYFNMLSASI